MIDNIKPELLCPVGGKYQLIAAVENGADAIYLGGAEFNARMYADNFTDIDFLEYAVDYSHLRNVKVYVTLNTLVNDNEIDRAVDYAKKLYKIGVDSVIVQDLGLIDRISKEIPKLKIHVSTQATVYSKEGVEFFNNNNIDRIVLARELSLEEIEKITQNVDKEIEIFVHGALCVCYSGQCKLSSQIGARSGNRGKCAQPCRLPYRLEEKGGNIAEDDYYLSTKDICTIDILPKVIKSGVHSLKIEGRMKSPEYVAAVTRIYRKYIDKCFEDEEYIVEDEDRHTLMQVFNRGGFSSGYLEGKNSSKLWCNTRPKHWGTYLGKVLEYNEKKNNIKIKLEQDIAIGDGVEIVNDNTPGGIVSFIRNENVRVKEAKKGDIVILGDIKGNIKEGQDVYKITSKKLNETLKLYFSGKSIKKNSVNLNIEMKIGRKIKVNANCTVLGKRFSIELQEGIECEKGIKKSISKEEVKSQFNKTGDVPFIVENIEIDVEEGLITPISNVNYVRRKVFEVLSDKIVKSFKHRALDENKNIKGQDKKGLIKDRNTTTKLSAYIYDISLLDNLDELERLDRVYISLEDIVKYKDEILNKIEKEKIYVYFPTVTLAKYMKFIKENMNVIKEINNLLVTNVEHINMFKDMKLNLFLDNSFNIFNSDALNKITSFNIEGVNLSNELTLEQIKNMKGVDNKKLEVDIYGNLQAMYSNFCTISAGVSKKEGCRNCITTRYSLKDRKNKLFPALYNKIDCNMRILNSDKLFSKDAVESLNGKVDFMRLYIYDEKKEDRKRVIDIVKNILNGKKTDNILISNEKIHFTNGHFYKDV